MRYLRGIMDLKLTYSKNADVNIVSFRDADWANDPSDRKSVTGCTFMSSEAAIFWFSKRQRTVAL